MPAPQLPPHVRALLDPALYTDTTPCVSLVETHISWVLLAGDRVYKLRKPVNLGFLDFSTLAKRRIDCDNEVRLNQRLAPGIYLGVERVVARGGQYRLGGRGRVVDYAVVMRRIDETCFLDVMLRDGRAGEQHIRRVAEALAGFHARAEGGPEVSRYGRPAVLRANWRDNFEQWASWVGPVLTVAEDAEIRSFVDRTLRDRSASLLARIADGRIREGHGDLRAAQIAFEDGSVVILDCVEFSRRLRSIDGAADAAFLAMDLDANGRHDLSRAFVRHYIGEAGDYAAPSLLPLYLAHRAAVRAKVALLRSRQLEGAARTAAEREARRYFDLVLTYIRRRDAPVLVVMCGLSGTGKSTLAAEIVRRTGARIFASDEVRKRLAGVPLRERAPASVYSRQWTEKTYAALFRRARRALARGHDVVLDATFPTRDFRRQALAIAHDAGARFLCVETTLPVEEVRGRLAMRVERGGAVSDATWDVHMRQRDAWEPVTELPAGEHLRVSTKDIPPVLETVLERLLTPRLV